MVCDRAGQERVFLFYMKAFRRAMTDVVLFSDLRAFVRRWPSDWSVRIFPDFAPVSPALPPMAAPVGLFIAPDWLLAQSCVVNTTVAECSSAGYHPGWASAMAAARARAGQLAGAGLG